MIRIAAVGDIHMGADTQGALRPAFETLPECADLLLLAGDLTRHGTVEEARVVADEIRGLGVPVVAVLGNHDHHDERPDEEGCDVRVALTHYSPVPETLAGEPLEIYPFLGSYLLAEAIDTAGADLALHGHAHRGSEQGMTAGGVQV